MNHVEYATQLASEIQQRVILFNQLTLVIPQAGFKPIPIQLLQNLPTGKQPVASAQTNGSPALQTQAMPQTAGTTSEQKRVARRAKAKRQISAEGKQRIAEAQRKRWASRPEQAMQ